MSQNRIEQLIEELYEYIEGWKPKGLGFNNAQIVVMKEEVCDILDEMKLKIPEEIKRCAKVVAQKDQIIASAEERAERIIADAKRQADMLVQDSEIMRRAIVQANEFSAKAVQQAEEMLRQASTEADMMSTGALRYTNDMLSVAERVMTMAYNETKEKNEQMLRTFEENLRILQENRRELTEEVAPRREEAAGTTGSDDDDDMYNIDSDAFLDNIEE